MLASFFHYDYEVWHYVFSSTASYSKLEICYHMSLFHFPHIIPLIFWELSLHDICRTLQNALNLCTRNEVRFCNSIVLRLGWGAVWDFMPRPWHEDDTNANANANALALCPCRHTHWNQDCLGCPTKIGAYITSSIMRHPFTHQVQIPKCSTIGL